MLLLRRVHTYFSSTFLHWRKEPSEPAMSNPTLLVWLPGGLWTAISVLLLSIFWFGVLRPRRGRCKNAPPLVLHAKNGIPFIGVLIEFFSSPNAMVERCLKDYGPIFTIPVRGTFWNLFSFDIYSNFFHWTVNTDFSQAPHFFDWPRGTGNLLQSIGRRLIPTRSVRLYETRLRRRCSL